MSDATNSAEWNIRQAVIAKLSGATYALTRVFDSRKVEWEGKVTDIANYPALNVFTKIVRDSVTAPQAFKVLRSTDVVVQGQVMFLPANGSSSTAADAEIVRLLENFADQAQPLMLAALQPPLCNPLSTPKDTEIQRAYALDSDAEIRTGQFYIRIPVTYQLTFTNTLGNPAALKMISTVFDFGEPAPKVQADVVGLDV